MLLYLNRDYCGDEKYEEIVKNRGIKLASIVFCVTGLIKLNVCAQKPDIFILRTEDNNAALHADTSDCKFHTEIKEIRISDNLYPKISFGGEVRLNYRLNMQSDFGDIPAYKDSKESFLLQRYMQHTDIDISKNIRGFLQLTSNHVLGKDYYTPEIEKNQLAIHQAFVDFKFNSQAEFIIRLGKQEYSYGNDAMLSMREGPNVRLTYAGGKFTVRKNNLNVDLLIARPVISNVGVFDDELNKSELIYGLYGIYNDFTKYQLDFYYLGATRKDAIIIYNSNEETRHSVGAKIKKSVKSFTVDMESTYQFGNWGDYNISALQFITSLTKSFNTTLSPVITFNYYLHTGDVDSTDTKINTFRPISSRPSTGSLFAFGSSNNQTVALGGNISPMNDLTLGVRYFGVWLYSLSDVLYTPDCAFPIRGLSQSGKFYARGIEFSALYNLNKHFSFKTLYGAFFPESYATSTGLGKKTKNLYVNITYKF